jgi:hypothetical protein
MAARKKAVRDEARTKKQKEVKEKRLLERKP